MKPFHFSTFPLLKFVYFPTETMQRMFPTQAKSPPPPVVEEVSVHFLTKVTPKSWWGWCGLTLLLKQTPAACRFLTRLEFAKAPHSYHVLCQHRPCRDESVQLSELNRFIQRSIQQAFGSTSFIDLSWTLSDLELQGRILISYSYAHPVNPVQLKSSSQSSMQVLKSSVKDLPQPFSKPEVIYRCSRRLKCRYSQKTPPWLAWAQDSTGILAFFELKVLGKKVSLGRNWAFAGKSSRQFIFQNALIDMGSHHPHRRRQFKSVLLLLPQLAGCVASESCNAGCKLIAAPLTLGKTVFFLETGVARVKRKLDSTVSARQQAAVELKSLWAVSSSPNHSLNENYVKCPLIPSTCSGTTQSSKFAWLSVAPWLAASGLARSWKAQWWKLGPRRDSAHPGPPSATHETWKSCT